MPSLEVLQSLHLTIDPTANFLICCQQECRYALSPNLTQVSNHLGDKRHILNEVPRQVTQVLNGHLLQDPAQAAPQDDEAPEIVNLRVYGGYVCRSCDFRTINETTARRHVGDKHAEVMK
jgi:hypothetical protein